jgi:hypothetical protein
MAVEVGGQDAARQWAMDWILAAHMETQAAQLINGRKPPMTMNELRNGVSYTVPAEQRGYTPPIPPETFEPPKVTASAVQVDGTAVEKAHASFANAKSQFEKFLNDIPREHYSPEGLTAQIAKFGDTDAARQVDAAVEAVRVREEQAAADYAKIRRDLSPAGDTAAELRAGRYWSRTKGVLDASKEGAFAKAQTLIASADREQLGVLLQELPSYLEAHGHTSEWLDAAIGAVVPEYALAAGQLKKARQARTIAEYNANTLRRSFAQGHSSSVITDTRSYDPDR